jgi:predicted  nucleic acid-binding Zn-ribbon protein
MDVIRTSIKRDDEEQALCTQRLEAAEARVRDYIESTAEQRSGLEAQREEAATGVPHHALVMFNRTAERHEGEALAPIMRLHPKRDEYACGGCNMKVTLETVNLLRSRDELRTCSACGRILFMES